MYRVMKTHDFDKSVFYRVACDCTEPDHDMTIEMEIDNDFPNIGLHIYAKLESSVYWGGSNWFERQWKRIKYSMSLLFKGWIEVEQEFLFINDEHISNFIEALEDGREKMRKLTPEQESSK